ncbi:MAG: hypothetical protein IJK23_10390 [Clostridia bacterium]|nr:hypothetical protein [Clostridia bacterium]
MFSLSIAEATNTSYGFANNYNSSSTRLATNTEYTANGGTFGYSSANGTGNSYWWLRSPGSDAGYKAYIDWDGAVVVDGLYIDYTMIAVRPAMNLDLSKVVFTSAAEGGKPGDGSFSPISDYNGTEWKLTLLDASRTFAVTETSATAVAGGSVTLHYSGAAVGANEYVSAIVTNAAGDVLYYGRLAQPEAAEGDLTLTVPALGTGSYTLKTFSEQYNGDFNTDFASAFEDVSLTVITQLAMDKINAKAELETYKNAADYRAAEQVELAAAIAAGTVLTEGTSYTVTYSSGCKAKGTYTVTVTAIGSYYTGTVEKTFTIK